MTEAKADNATILVVDDSRLMRVAARKILKNDFDIVEAEDGEVAWEVLQNNRQITLVMSDLSMPNLDGLGLLKKIRESSEAHLKELPVIIVTGAEDDDGSKKTALSAGASDFITKPFESVQLLARTQAQAKQQRTQQALQESETSKQQLEEQSSVDTLTGLINQRAFNDNIEESLSYAIRHRSELALLLIRVEKYKVLFLRRGKQTAEEVLRRLAPMLSDGRRREDAVARIGLDTFAPVSEEDPTQHKIHTEWCQVTPEAADAINQTKSLGGRVIAVGTTSVRTLESAASGAAPDQLVAPFDGPTDLFILHYRAFLAAYVQLLH